MVQIPSRPSPRLQFMTLTTWTAEPFFDRIPILSMNIGRMTKLMLEASAVPSSLLTSSEISFLRRALAEWGGPARCSDELAFGMGFDSKTDLLDRCRSFKAALMNDAPLAPADWARMLLAVEIVFVSDLAGSGVDWRTTTGFSDATTIDTLRLIQRKLAQTVRAFYGKRPSS